MNNAGDSRAASLIYVMPGASPGEYSLTTTSSGHPSNALSDVYGSLTQVLDQCRWGQPEPSLTPQEMKTLEDAEDAIEHTQQIDPNTGLETLDLQKGLVTSRRWEEPERARGILELRLAQNAAAALTGVACSQYKRDPEPTYRHPAEDIADVLSQQGPDGRELNSKLARFVADYVREENARIADDLGKEPPKDERTPELIVDEIGEVVAEAEKKPEANRAGFIAGVRELEKDRIWRGESPTAYEKRWNSPTGQNPGGPRQRR